MFKYFWNKLKDFIVSRSRFTRVTMVFLALAILVGIFGVVQPAYADLWDDIASIFAAMFILIASFLGNILVLIIGILLEIVSYNDFVDATAVNTGWIIVRDICNLFFVLVLLVIGFGSILRLENFKFNKLLGKLVIMIILVNFSKMIAGFFIDISQVVLMTFANAFSSTAAANFTDGLRLKEMLGLYDQNAITGVGDQLGAWEKMGVALLPVVLLIVAIFVMGAMVAVFLMRIVMLWVLVVLSPLAYLLSVLPSTKQYSDQWWKTFTKWVVTGPALAFFIWFGLTLIASGGTESVNLEQENQAINIGAGGNRFAGGIGEISSSDNLLQFSFAIALFIISLVMSQSLGGIAGSMAGKTLGKLQGMGSAALKKAGAPLRGARDVAKMGGRKIRREYRDSTLGKYTNVGAMIEGAKQRGEEVEQRSMERATQKGRNLWDQRPEWMGGGADVPDGEELLERRYERQAASEVSTLQKEQKSALLQQVWNKSGKEAETTRRGLLQSLAAEGHIDDALATDFFKKEAVWYNDKGEKQVGFGFGEDNSEYDNNLSRSNFLRSTISRGRNRSIKAKDTDSVAFGTLYDIQEAGIKNKHYEYAGEVVTGEDGNLTYAEEVGKDRMTYKNEVITGEQVKPTDRIRVGVHPHNYTVQATDKEGKNMRLIPFDDPNHEAQYKDWQQKVAYSAGNDKSFREFSSARIGDILGGFNSKKKTFQVNNDPRMMDQIKKLYQEFPQITEQIEKKYGAKGYEYTDANGQVKKVDNLHQMAKDLGWDENSDYHSTETANQKQREAETRKIRSRATNEDNQATEKEEKARELRQEAGQTGGNISRLEAQYDTEAQAASKLEQEAQKSRQDYEAMPKAGFEAGTPENIEKRQKMEQELLTKEKKASEARIKANDTKEKLDQEYSKKEGTDKDKIKEAERLEKESRQHRTNAEEWRVSGRIEEFREETNNDEVIDDIKTNVKSGDVQKIADAIEDAMAKVIASTQGVESSVFENDINKISQEIYGALGKLQKTPPNTTTKLTNELNTMIASAGSVTQKGEQEKMIKLLGNISTLLARRSAGKGIDDKEKITSAAKKSADNDYNE